MKLGGRRRQERATALCNLLDQLRPEEKKVGVHTGSAIPYFPEAGTMSMLMVAGEYLYMEPVA